MLRILYLFFEILLGSEQLHTFYIFVRSFVHRIQQSMLLN